MILDRLRWLALHQILHMVLHDIKRVDYRRVPLCLLHLICALLDALEKHLVATWVNLYVKSSLKVFVFLVHFHYNLN